MGTAHFCFPERPAVLCTLQPAKQYEQYSVLMEQGKFYFTEEYYQDIDLGTVCIYPADTIVSPYQQLPGPRTMTYVSTGDFSERPYFSDWGQVWEYVQKNGQIV